MTKNSSVIVFITIMIVVLASCKKEKAVATLPESKEQSQVTAISANIAAYDYSKPVGDILRDAGIRNPIVDPYLVLVREGTFLFIYEDRVICNPRGPVCEIIVIHMKENRLYVAGNNTIIEGSAEYPVRVVQALPKGPVYREASRLSYTETEEKVEIDHSYLP